MNFSNILSAFGYKKVIKLFEAQGLSTDEAQKMATVLATEEYLLEDGRAIEYDLDTKKALIVMAGGLKCPIPSGSIKLSDGTSIDVVAHTPEEIAAVVGKVEVEVEPSETEPVIETPLAETPAIETPMAETPAVETPLADTPETTEMMDVETTDGQILSFTETGQPVLLDGAIALEGKYTGKNGQIFIVDANGMLSEMTPLAAAGTQPPTMMENETAAYKKLEAQVAELTKKFATIETEKQALVERNQKLVETNKKLAAKPTEFAAVETKDIEAANKPAKKETRFGAFDNLLKKGETNA